MDQFLDIISAIHPLSADFIQALEDHHDYIKPAKNQLYLSSGQICRKCGFIISGAAAAFQGNDMSQVVDFWQRNDFILPGYSLYTERPSDEGIVFLKNSKIIQLRRSTIIMLKNNYLEARIIFNHFDAVNEQRAKDRAKMISMTASERLEDYENRFPGIARLISRAQEASYIGITPSTRSRI